MNRVRSALAISVLVVPMLAALLIVSVTSSQAQIVRAEDAVIALFGLQTSMEVELRLLHREEGRYDINLRQRSAITSHLTTLHAELEDLFRRERGEGSREEEIFENEEPSEDRIRRAAEAKEMEVRAQERAQTASRDEGRTIRDEIRRFKSRIAILKQKIVELQASLPHDRDSVTGLWDISIMPSGDKGVFALWQSGTLISGQYVLDGPFRGSLEGTLINRQILIRRIDAKLGRSMEFSGYLADDGKSIQGTWLNYNLSSGVRPTGAWSARKRQSVLSDATPDLSQEP